MSNRFILFIIFSFLSLSLVYSQSITVTEPDPGEIWYKGTTYNITWTANGCQDTSYKINIFRDSITVSNFVEQLTANNTTSKSWTIPDTYTNGNYAIRIKTADNVCIGDSGIFIISDPPGGTLTVTEPDPGDDWIKGSDYNIMWTSSGCSDNNVKINIFRNSILQSNFVEQIQASNTGTKSWTVPMSYTAGNYILRIKTSDNLCIGDSGVFQITDPLPSTISVTNPSEGVDWEINSTHTIEWTKSGNMGGSVRITLHKYNVGSGLSPIVTSTIASSTANDNSHSWTIPSSIPPASYSIRIRTTDNLISGDSEIFQISQPVQSGVVEPVRVLHTLPNNKADLYVKSLRISQSTGSGIYNVELFPVIGNAGGGGIAEAFKVDISVKNFSDGSLTKLFPINYIYSPGRKLGPGMDTSSWNYGALHKTVNPGKCIVYVIVDKANVSKEKLWTKTNNKKEFNLTISPLSDLQICGSANLKSYMQMPVKLTLTVENIGDKKSTPCKLKFYMNRKGIQEINIPAINKGASHTPLFNPVFCTEIVGNLTIMVDSSLSNTEKNEKNNVINFVIYGSPPAKPKPADQMQTKCGNYEDWLVIKNM